MSCATEVMVWLRDDERIISRGQKSARVHEAGWWAYLLRGRNSRRRDACEWTQELRPPACTSHVFSKT